MTLQELAGGLLTLAKTMATPGAKTKYLTRQQGQELVRLLDVTAAVIFAYTWRAEEEDDDSFLGRWRKNAMRELSTLFQSLPALLSLGAGAGPVLLGKIATHLLLLAKMEEYKTREGLKGLEGLKKDITPSAIRDWLPKEDD
jgi:hypothetical protein